MGVEFDWRVEEDEPENQKPQNNPNLRWLRVSVGVLAVLVLGAYVLRLMWRQQLTKLDEQLIGEVQSTLNVAGSAAQSGDGELFFSLMSDEVHWQLSHLDPVQQQFFQSEPTIVDAIERGDAVWATAEWEWQGETARRMLFLEREEERLQLVPPNSADWVSDEAYWGNRTRLPQPWGQIIAYEADVALEGQIDQLVQAVRIRECPAQPAEYAQCGAISLEISHHYRIQEGGSTLTFPSPRIYALDENGEPAERYWDDLESYLVSRINPQQVRYGVPQAEVGRYQRQVRVYAAEHADFPPIEIVALESFDSVEAALLSLDGAQLRPTIDLIAKGYIREMSGYWGGSQAQLNDMYAPVWDGITWRNHVWMWPHALEMNLLFYDQQYQRQVNEQRAIDEAWSFDVFADHIALIGDITPIDGFMSPTQDLFYAHAFSHQADGALSAETIADTLDWYASLNGVYDMSQVAPDQHAIITLRALSSNRQVALWTERPELYEYHHQLNKVETMPFPASAAGDSIAPMWVNGGVISRSTTNPYATWNFINFLSYQSADPSQRLIPARPSVAREIRYWQMLPEPVHTVMSQAFPTARTVSIAEQDVFRWDQIEGVMVGGVVSAEAAAPLRINWFNRAND